MNNNDQYCCPNGKSKRHNSIDMAARRHRTGVSILTIYAQQYAEMADAITRYEKLLVVAPEPELVKKGTQQETDKLSVGQYNIP